MDERAFVEGSRETWEQLAALVAEARADGVTRLGASRLRTLHEAYRRTAADLAYAQTHFPRSASEEYLNGLVGDAHAELYGAAPRKLSSIWRFMMAGYPRLARRYSRDVVLSAALLFGAAALGFLLAYINYPLARLFIPEALRDGVGDTIARGKDVTDLASAIAPLLSAGITVNNVQVSLLAFAGGMTFGAVTVYALITNGLMLGALAGVFSKAGASQYFWALIVPHGSLELPAIVLAGASGLILARALLAPGDLPRLDALKTVSGDAVRLVLGAIPLLVVAGLIEGFFTPAPIDPMAKIAFGTLMAALFAAYITIPGRGDETARRRR